MTAKDVVSKLGPEVTMEAAGMLLASATASSDPDQREAGERVVTELLDAAGEVPTSATEVARSQEAPDASAYVPDVWSEDITFHRAEERSLPNGGHGWATPCNLLVRWHTTTALVPFRVAALIGQPCASCYAPEPTED